MSLPKHIIDQLVDFTRSKWRTPNCQLCGHNEWTVEGVLDIRVKHRDGSLEAALRATQPSFPCAAFICRNCGNTVLISLVAAGVVTQ